MLLTCYRPQVRGSSRPFKSSPCVGHLLRQVYESNFALGQGLWRVEPTTYWGAQAKGWAYSKGLNERLGQAQQHLWQKALSSWSQPQQQHKSAGTGHYKISKIIPIKYVVTMQEHSSSRSIAPPGAQLLQKQNRQALSSWSQPWPRQAFPIRASHTLPSTSCTCLNCSPICHLFDI